MVRRSELFGISIVAIVCLLLIGFSQKDVSTYQRSHRYQQYLDLDDSFKYTNNTVPSIDDVISNKNSLLSKELFNYKFPEGTSLEDYTLSTGGRPIRTVIITTWRSGSTFLGDILNAVPGNYYHYEPLLEFGITQIRGNPEARQALDTLKSLLHCDYSSLYSYLNFGMSHVYLFTHNTRLWDQCELYPAYCWNATFLSKFCKLFPFQSMKSVRLRLALAEELLQDDDLNIKVILLVRDPRGTMQSRKHRDWCPGVPDCDQPSNLCKDLISDYEAAGTLQMFYSDRFRVLRYEDLSLNPSVIIRDLFDFLGLYFHKDVEKFLNTHTKFDIGGVSSTFRDSKSAPFHWKADLDYTEIQNIEEACEEAMKLWGYVRAKNVTDMKEFNPLTSYSIN
ncbi:carbohydrate sulfotransferase 4-like [Diorhabda carinulata]|uniref:carbohydrate sulfotransferase 4-like n=1 Tax=Diorhabda carinulata TaxID=1163345 RepID=UPI0025A22332|nr:carbohydrate sulfotransferase 4-like [Diorhabda carinulata]